MREKGVGGGGLGRVEENDRNTKGEEGRAQWNLNGPKHEYEQQHHKCHHLLSRRRWRIETGEERLLD